MMRFFRIRNIILPLLTLLAVVSAPETKAAEPVNGRAIKYIGTAQEYIDFVTAVNAGDYDLCAVLTADIDLSGMIVSPIGSFANSYVGIFDGKGHVISNMRISMAQDRVGMFGRIDGNAHVCNFILDNPYFEGNNHVGIIAECYNSTKKTAVIENIGFRNGTSKVTTGGANAGGILGRASGVNGKVVVRNCFVIGSISGSSTISSICAFSEDNKVTYSNCWSDATVESGTPDSSTFTHGTCSIDNCRDNNLGNGLTAPDEAYFASLVTNFGWKRDTNGGIVPPVVNTDVELSAYLRGWAEPGDFKYDLADYKFVHSHGPASAVNRGVKDTPTMQEWCDWERCFDEDGNWLLDVDALRNAGIEPPDFTFMTSKDDPRIKNGVRQRAHTNEQVVYALPGDVVVLYPFREFYRGATTNDGNYRENYIRWYDFATDGTNKYLGFYTDPDGVYKTENNGYFGGKGVNLSKAPADNTVHISTVDGYIAFANRVNNGDKDLNAVLDADLDFEGRTDVPPIGQQYGRWYAGTFDGQGHTIYNLKIVNKDRERLGMFGGVQGPAVIRNFKLVNAYFEGKTQVAVVGYNNGQGDWDKPRSILIENVGFSGTSIAHEKNAAGILGASNSNNGAFAQTIRNCYVTGTIQGGKESAALSGYAINTDIENCWSTATVTGADKPSSTGMTYTFTRGYPSSKSQHVRLKNCYAIDGGNNLPTTPEDVNSQDFANLLGNTHWKVSETDGHVVPYVKKGNRLSNAFSPKITTPTPGDVSERSATIATFYVPEDEEFKEDMYIACDVSQSFIIENNIDVENKTIYEPTTAFRQLFTIKNGATFAEEFSGSVEKNNEYIRKNRRHIKAMAGVGFQIRLDFKMPKTNDGVSNIYYKKEDGTYDRVHMFDIQVVDRTTGQRTGQLHFDPVGEYEGQKTRNGVNIGEGGSQYYRGITCGNRWSGGNVIEGSYMVRLIAKDGNGNIINIAGTSTPLVVAEYELDIENSTEMSLVDEATLTTDPAYAEHTDKFLEELYGKPYTTLDYDQYRFFEQLSTPENYLLTAVSPYARQIKWPKPWDRSTYGYAYNVWNTNAYSDYNQYVYASHTSATPWHQAADSNNSAADNFGVANGLFDRLFYDTQGKEQGYFGYVNAAADPGVVGNLYIDDMCDGSTVIGTAWVAECSQSNEVANIIFNFNAELKDGTTHALKSIATGYVPKQGKWLHFYFSFTPNLSKHGLTDADVVRYHVTIENNCLSSSGADYAIDDIRLYIVKPRVLANQSRPLCGDDQKTLDIRIETPFESMLASTGSVEAFNETVNELKYVYYSFVDKAKYDYAIKKASTHQDAYEEAVLRYDYNLGGRTQRFGRFTFNSYYAKNPEYVGFTDVISEAAYVRVNPETGERMLVFNTRPQDNELVPNKEYYIVFYPSVDNKEIDEIKKNPSVYFEIMNNDGSINSCAKIGVFKVEPNGVIKIDGIAVPDYGALKVCENHSPVIHIDLVGASTDGTRSMEVVDKNSSMDWYSGSMAAYRAEKITVGGKDLYLTETLTAFRAQYPDADTWDCPAKGRYTEAMRQYLKTMTTVNPLTHKAKLELYRSSYLFAPAKYNEISYVVAIPLAFEGEDYIICTEPIELKVNVSEHSPRISHGLPVEYPEDMTDVPLRIGLSQIHQVSGDYDALIAGTANVPSLNVPLRSVNPVTAGVTTMLPGDDPVVYLVETNDPEYALALTAGTELVEEDLYEVGKLDNIVAVKDGAENVISLSFFNNFRFKEGYYYRLRFDFAEDETQIANPDDPNNTACGGQQVFTIKVVPEYAQWTGEAGNRNWNNDLNWRRVTSDELLRTQSATDEFTTDGANANPFAYSPLNFTKTIIPAGIDSPYLFNVPTTDFEMAENGVTETFSQCSTPNDVVAGDATLDIEYDMASRPKGDNINCGPWYAHTCEQIHFNTNAEIMNQQHLAYDRAWVDFETAPQRWYTLASPLRSTVAGDMYLPTADARQSTELFKPITFKTDLNDRFAPAVYQRAWNKAKAIVYEIKDGPSRNVAVKTVWSNVYNDVNEKYTAGTGFSINTDVSRLGSTVGNVKFRLPKDDATFDYYNEDGTIVGNNTTVDRTDAYRLNDVDGTVTVQSGAPCRYFLVGNPFMAHIDMAKFLNANADKINPKYWVLTDGGYAAVVKDDADSFTATLANPGALAPMQGFFVETKTESDNVTLTYSADMITEMTYTGGDSPLHSPSRSSAVDDGLRITAMTYAETPSQAIVRIAPDAVREYNEREDVAMLNSEDVADAAKIYTVAGDMAASINSLPEIGTTEIGLLVDDNRALTTLHFNGVDCVDGAMLYDVQTNEVTPLYEDMEYTVEGSAVGRLFITNKKPDIIDSAIRITQTGSTVTVTSSLPVTVNVYDIAGRRILARQADSGIASFTLDQGVFIIEAANSEDLTRTKIAVR